eukprot:1155981-Pelagomonas_calceolata.AAC.5
MQTRAPPKHHLPEVAKGRVAEPAKHVCARLHLLSAHPVPLVGALHTMHMFADACEPHDHVKETLLTYHTYMQAHSRSHSPMQAAHGTTPFRLFYSVEQ